MDMGRGFTSYFLFDKKQKEFIEQQNSMANLDQFAVYSDTLYIDFDEPDDVDACKNKMLEQGLAFELYESGSKGYHYHIPLDKMYCGVDLPLKHKTWVKSLGFKIDDSIYRHAGLFRLPGTKHKKTGKLKQLVHKQEGQLLNMDNIVLEHKPKPRITCSLSTPATALNECLFNMINEPDVGGRYMKFWKMAKMLHEAEYTKEFAEELLITINFAWKNPKPVEEITRALREVYDK